MRPLATADSCSRRFGDHLVLSDVSLELPRGVLAAVIGANGSGKTSLLRMLAGTLTPTAGSIQVAEQAPSLGGGFMVPAGDRMLNWRLTGRMNLEFFARIAGRPGASRIDDVAESLGIRSQLEKRVGDCSTGQRRRMMVATGLVVERPLLLLDEPFADIDDEGVAAVVAALERYVSGGERGVLFASPSDADRRYAHPVFELIEGKIVS